MAEGTIPAEVTEQHISGDSADPEALRRHVLDVSNTQYESGTGLVPVKATCHPDEIKRVEETIGAVVVGPHEAGRVENRELATLSPEPRTPELEQAGLAGSTKSGDVKSARTDGSTSTAASGDGSAGTPGTTTASPAAADPVAPGSVRREA